MTEDAPPFPPDSLVGNRYRVTDELGRGGMARVYRASDTKHGRTVALKVLRTDVTVALGAERFHREVEIVARLNHPHIVPLFDSGAEDGLWYFVMPLVEGESLRQRLDRDTMLPIRDAVAIATDVASALEHAHRQGIIHRDIKPENILLGGGHALVADFGIARVIEHATRETLTSAGMAVGTVAYMSPEQVTASPVDQRSDLYSLGCVLFEMLSGTLPQRGDNARELLAQRLAVAPDDIRTRRAEVPERLAVLVSRLLQVDPALRPASAGEVVSELNAAIGDPAPVRSARRRHAVVAAIGVAAVAMAVAMAGLLVWQRGAPPAATLLEGARTPMVVVLPFANLTANPDDEYFADGLAEEIINTLGRVEGLDVAPRTSSFSFKGANLDVREVGRRLGATAVMEGSVRRAGAAMRVSARLVQVSDGRSLWNREWNEDAVTDPLAIQDSISRGIVREVLPRLDVTREITPLFFRTTNAAAHDLYLQGRFFWNQRSESGIKRAIDLFQQAITLDDRYAAAHAGLAEAYGVAAFYDYLLPARAFPLARKAAQRALELDPTAGEPHASLAYVLMYHDWNMKGAEDEIRTAIELRPGYSVTHQWYANLLTMEARYDEADAQWRRARELEPLSLIQVAAPGWMDYYKRDYRTMASVQQEALARDSSFVLSHYWLGLAQEQLGQLPDAVASFERALKLSHGGALALTGLAHALALSGQRDSARVLAGELQRRAATTHLPSFEVSTVYVALGDHEKAMDWLRRAFDERSHSMPFLRFDPRFDPVRRDPRFVRLEAMIRRGGEK